ncbi:hypothetical protein KY348_01600 [Candidatus Woesearchaeota archaeon]|nr:hypothetical protein [Candidatus Woesearchaeota archaeon]
MNIQMLIDEKNALFKRREIKARLGYEDKTPSRLEIRKELAKKLNTKEELVVVKRIKPDYGTTVAKLEINIYEDENSLKESEPEYMVNRHSAEKKEKKEAPAKKTKPEEAPKEGEKKETPEKEERADKPAEEKKEEKPAEKKEEIKAEEKKENKN